MLQFYISALEIWVILCIIKDFHCPGSFAVIMLVAKGRKVIQVLHMQIQMWSGFYWFPSKASGLGGPAPAPCFTQGPPCL